ncbi:cytochrome P450 90B2-like [Iris pallida]|uniref:Cytochrome P450 90B2-like n=1 Tax=Iris pallida TaxID=29817 RepID=A0AAX6GUK1_IRIPA|nr:cytochrome P450 90B2-like [Iris pallida]
MGEATIMSTATGGGGATVVVPVVVLPLVAILVMTYLFLKRSTTNVRKGDANFPPGYSGWPLVGEFFEFMKPFPSYTPGTYMTKRIQKFGKIFTTNLLGKKMIVSADAELTRLMLTNEMKTFETEWPEHYKKLMGESSILILNGEEHRLLRNSVLNFFSFARLESHFLKDANEIATGIMSSWREGKVISALGASETYTLDFALKNVMGMRPGEPEVEQFRHDYHEFREGLLFALPINFPGTLYNKSLKARGKVQKVIRRIYDERRKIEGCRGPRGDDYIGWTMSGTNLTRDMICDLMQGALFASEETTSRAISLIMFFLEGSPKALEHLREEHLKVRMPRDKDGWSMLSWEGYKQLQFTQCVTNESLRLGNITRFLVKKALADVTFKGYLITKGTPVVASFASAHFDPSLFKDPESFDPWRWQTSSGILKTNNFFPFSGGPRLCPGAELARVEIAVFLHHLLLNFDYKLADDDKPTAFPVINFPKGYPIKVTPRE